MDSRPTSPEPPSIPPVPAKRRRRRWLRLTVGIVVVFALVVVAAPHAIGLDLVRTRIEASLARELGAPCKIAGLGFSWFSGLVVMGLEIGNPSGFPAERPCLRLRRAEGELQLLPLLRGRVDFTGTLDGLQVFVEQRADGATNLGALGHPSPEPSEREPSPPSSDPDRGSGFDLGRLRLQVDLLDSTLEIRRGEQLLESLTEVSCRARKGFDSERISLDLDAKLRPSAATAPPGRLGVKLEADIAGMNADAVCSATQLDLQRYGPVVQTFWPGQLTTLAGIVNGTLNVSSRDRRAFTLTGEMSVAAPHLAGPALSGMVVQGERWTLGRELSVRLGSGSEPAAIEAENFTADLGFLRVRGLTKEQARPVLADGPGLGLAYELDVDALAAFGGPIPAWLQGTSGKVVGELGVPLSGGAFDFTRLRDEIVATARIRATKLAAAGFELRDLAGSGELRHGAFRFDTAPTTLLNQGGLVVSVRTDVRDRERMPTSVGLRWQGGRLQAGATELLALVVPLFAGLDSATANLSGQCDLEFSFAGPAQRTGQQTWLQLLNLWSGSGSVGLRDTALTPAPALAGLLSPLGNFVGVDTSLGNGGRLAIDSFTAPFTMRVGTIETKAGRWLAKGKAIGLSGTARLDGVLDYGFDLSALLRGHRDGDRVLQAAGGSLPAARLTGTVQQPSLGLPDLRDLLNKVLQNELEGRGRDLLQRELEKLLKRKS